MAGNNWSIMLQDREGKLCFDPDVYGCDPSTPLKSQLDDLISWNNQSSEPHQIVVTNSTGGTSFTTDVIDKYKSSFPGYVTAQGDVANNTISYYCSLHPDRNEKGTITVVP